MFSVPMVLHVIMMIPSILVSVVIISINYDVVFIGHGTHISRLTTLYLSYRGQRFRPNKWRHQRKSSTYPIDGNEHLKGGEISSIALFVW
jgi:hypothetical protein